MLKPTTLTAAPAVRMMINVGALMDIPTGWYVQGKYGEHILLGGIGPTDATAGKGNNFKSTLMHYKTCCAASRMFNKTGISISTYDSETNMFEDRLKSFTQRFDNLKDRNLFLDNEWIITDKTVCYVNTWFDGLKEYLKAKRKEAPKGLVETPFLDRNGIDRMKILPPTFSQTDSISNVETDDVAAIAAGTEIGESDANHIYLRQGLGKKRLIDEMIAHGPSSSHFFLMCTHYGKDKAIGGGSGPFKAPPPKTLNALKPGEKPKGVPDNFFYLTHNCWLADGASKLIHRESKGPWYPKEGHEGGDGGVDLYTVPITMLRSKSGPSDYSVTIVVSQTEGVLPALTEFHAMMENERFGIEGTLQHYAVTLAPETKLSRTTVRTKLDNDLRLCRAVNITSELMQMGQFFRTMRSFLPTPKQLYEGLKEKGYDWDMILTKTRGWWTVNNESHPLHFLSTMDLVRMYLGTYHPYWLEEDKKTIKKQFLVS